MNGEESYHGEMMTVRKIIHIDMDAFFSSVEQRDHPELRGRPVVVGGSPRSRGVVCTCSYEARKFGIRSAMPTARAYQLCPEAIFVKPRFEKYVEASKKIREIFKTITDLVEPLSLDEAYLDVTENKLSEKLASKIAVHIKNEIYSQLQLTASAGVANNKMIAKIASDYQKPNGLTVVPPERALEFLTPLTANKISGVGPATYEKLKSRGLITIGDLRSVSIPELQMLVGSFAPRLHELAFGRDDRVVNTSRVTKSVGSETTFAEDIQGLGKLKEILWGLAAEVFERLDEKKIYGKTVTLKLRYFDFKTITRSQTCAQEIKTCEDLSAIAYQLLEKYTEAENIPVRLIGLTSSSFSNEKDPVQLDFDFS